MVEKELELQVLTLFSFLIVATIAIPNAVIAVELFAGLWPRKLVLNITPLPRIAVLVPAHNEAVGIEVMLARVRSLLPTGARLLVVADNCTDDTAERARAAGAEVVERDDPAARGKGHALAHGRKALESIEVAELPEVVIVLDADCVPEPGAIGRLAQGAAATGKPIQACYLLEPRPKAAPMVQISGLAFLIKNLIRQAGLSRIGAPVVLTGSGMAFPWRLFVAAPLATDDIVEDLAIGVALARTGAAPQFEPTARIWSAPAGERGTLSQRTRWEHGFARTAANLTLPLLAEGFLKRQFGLAWLGLHVAVPPLALLLGIDVVASAILAILWFTGSALLPLILGVMLISLVAIGVFLAWILHGSDQVKATVLLRAPLYLLWKLRIYVKLIQGVETRWIRTDRQ